MKNIYRILIAFFLQATSTLAQPFDLISAKPEQKVAESPLFTISNNAMNLYASTNLSRPFAVVNNDTFVVDRSSQTTSVNHNQTVINDFTLEQNYPNPFNMSTVIRYSLPEDADVTIKVYDIIGKEIGTLVHSKQAAGVHSVGFGNNTLSSGTYFYRLTVVSGDGKTHIETKKMIAMK
ncbi:MAG: T9SS type A sorting domain-containing protein [Ignavibacteriales bacterium]|nr:T9SS type A sorting domain-containing protein [Ignavibacteriales bacterium]